MMSIARIVLAAMLSGSSLLVLSSAFAQAPTCDANCQREAAAAGRAKSQGNLNTQGPDQYQQNALRRCERQPAGTPREACEKRVLGTGETSVRGSVQSGARLQTNTLQVPAQGKQ